MAPVQRPPGPGFSSVISPAWRETYDYSERGHAVLAWTEAVTLVASSQVPDDVFQLARQQFTEGELVNLTMAVVAINGWNRLSVSFRSPPEGESADDAGATTHARHNGHSWPTPGRQLSFPRQARPLVLNPPRS